jgi:hypothetical protein
MAPSEVHQAGQLMFTPVTHPDLRTLGRKKIHLFLRERERYLLRIADASASGDTVQAISIKASTDPELLQSLVDLGELGYDTETIEGVNEETLNQWLAARDEAKLETLSPDENKSAVLAAVRLNVNKPDAELRIMKLFMDYRTFLPSSKWGSIITTNRKVATAHICAYLKPAALKTCADNDFEMKKKNSKSNSKLRQVCHSESRFLRRICSTQSSTRVREIAGTKYDSISTRNISTRR